MRSKKTVNILMILKSDVDKLEIKTKDLKDQNVKFKFLDSGNRNKKFYYIAGNLPSYNYDENIDDLSEYGEELDYESIIAANKYNI